MKRKRKIVYSVTLHEDTAEWFRTLTPAGKLSPGLAHAQALLSLPGVLKVAIAAYETEEKERNERLKVSHQRSASPRARGAVPPPAATTSASGPRAALPVLPGGVIPPSVVLPTDNPFDDDTGPQGAPGDAAPDPGPMTDQERADIAAPEREVSGSSQGPIAPAQESEPDPSADIAEPKF